MKLITPEEAAELFTELKAVEKLIAALILKEKLSYRIFNLVLWTDFIVRFSRGN